MPSPVMSRPGPVILRRGPAAVLPTLAGLVIAGSLAVRLTMLGRQSYWIDELFSVSQAKAGLRHMVKLGSTEVHTPLYASLLWGWVRIGGTGVAWTRLLSTLCTAAAVAVAHRGLRGIGLSDPIRWALTVATAAGGTSIVYSLETRSYALLTLAAVGLTVTTLRAALLTLDGAPPTRGTLVGWTGWSCLAATAHLFGALLTLAALAVLAVTTLLRAPRPAARLLTWTLLAAAGCSVQAGWLLAGLARPGFASGTSWIRAPRGHDVWDLLTTTFSSGGLTAHADGFAWTSPAGVLIVAAMCAGAALAGRRSARQPGDAGTAEGRAAAVLLAVAALMIASVFGVSQWTHLWTLRNMAVVAPALSWGVICLVSAVAGTQTGRRWVATAMIALLGIGLVPTAIGVVHPYKTDFRGLFEYLATVRRSHPDASLFFVGPGPPLGWAPVNDPPGPGREAPGRDLDPRPVGSQRSVVRTPGTEVVVLYRGSADRHPRPAVTQLIAQLGASSCRSIPIYGLGVVRCD